jgi:hypothetical protein
MVSGASSALPERQQRKKQERRPEEAHICSLLYKLVVL